MTFRDYVFTIIGTNFFHKGQVRFIKSFFDAAGTVLDPNEPTIKTWLRKKNPQVCTIEDYFPKGAIDEKGFTAFFSSKMGASWTKLQDAFRLIKKNDDLVDVDTNNPDVFYWSLLNQFQRIHKLDLSEMPDSLGVQDDALEKDRSLEGVTSEPMFQMFTQAYHSCHIKEFAANNLFEGLSPDLLPWVERFISNIEMSLSKEEAANNEARATHRSISQYIHTIREYKNYVIKNTRPYERDAVTKLYIDYGNQAERTKHEESIKYYRQQLTSLYKEIHFGSL